MTHQQQRFEGKNRVHKFSQAPRRVQCAHLQNEAVCTGMILANRTIRKRKPLCTCR